MTVYLIDAPHYCAGVVVRDGVVTVAAPIVKWAIGKPWNEVSDYFNRKKFKITAAEDAANG